MLRRLPISLRFDDEDSDFYYGFIEQKKNDRELSTLILDLLHVYYENPMVQNILDEYVTRKSPYMYIHEQLERIALEHNKQSISTSMLDDYTDNEKKKVSENPEPINKEKDTSKSENEDNKTLMLPEETIKELQNLREEVSQMKGIKDELAEMKRMFENLTSLSGLNKGSETFINRDEVPKVSETPKVISPVIGTVEPPIISQKVEEHKGPILADVPELKIQEDGVKATIPGRKPSSFGKLLNSVK